jgi:hypothetical protein
MRRAPLDGETQGGSCQRPVLPALRWKSRYGITRHSSSLQFTPETMGHPVFTADSADRRNLILRSQALPRLSVHFLLKRVDQSLIVCAYPEISIPRDRANLCWARSIVLLEHSELLSVPGRDEKFHCKGLSLSVRINGSHARAVFWPEYVNASMDGHRSTLSESSAFTAQLPNRASLAPSRFAPDPQGEAPTSPGQNEVAVAQQFRSVFARSQRQEGLWNAGSRVENRQIAS